MILRPGMLIATVPALMGYVAGAVCPVGKNNSGAEIPFRPPAIVFGIVWPILYALFGWSMYLSLPRPASLALHLALAAMLTAWIPLTSCYGRIKEGVWLLLASVLVCSYAIAIDASGASKLLLLPLATWLSFATLMSAFQTYIARSKDTPPGS
jgi:tryptophan-rich sensory protein